MKYPNAALPKSSVTTTQSHQNMQLLTYGKAVYELDLENLLKHPSWLRVLAAKHALETESKKKREI